MRTEIFTGSPRNGKIFERCLSENYIAEITYQLLCAVDGVNELLGDPEFFADAAARAKRKKNGSLCANGGCDIPARCAPGRELPLVTGYVRLLNESATDTIRVTYGISHRLGDDWSEYQEPYRPTFAAR